MDKLLIVDDEEAMRRLMRINLEDRFEIIDTGNPDQALALALQEKPDAILLDLRMPRYSGFELCRTFSSLNSTQLIPLVIVSGESGANIRSVCKDLGAAAYFEKPVDFDALRAGLTNVLHTARPERRAQARVRLRVKLKLMGIDIDDKSFSEISATENISQNGFLCGCTAVLKMDSEIAIYLISGEARHVGTARVVWTTGKNTDYPSYGFQFIGKTGEWILK
jgi:DNA-binding response OmpR family regulator